MNERGVNAFVRAIFSDCSPRPFRASPSEVQVIQAAIQQCSHRAQLVTPDPGFVRDLHHELSVPPLPTMKQRGTVIRGLGQAAAAALLVAGTFTAADLTGSRPPAPVIRAVTATPVRSGVLVSADGRALGRTYAFGGRPSWVVLDLIGSSLTGVYTCEFHLAGGTTVPAGVVTVYNGSGDWAHTVGFRVNQLRSATLVSSNGTTVAGASFS